MHELQRSTDSGLGGYPELIHRESRISLEIAQRIVLDLNNTTIYSVYSNIRQGNGTVENARSAL